MAARVARGGIAAAVGLWLLSGFYVVEPNERAIITRLGAYTGIENPGWRYHLPTPIEDAELVDVASEQTIVIGGPDGSGSQGDGLMPTSDGNIVDLGYSVQYHIADPAAWRFKVRDPQDAIRTAAESAMREVVGQSDLGSVLTSGRGGLQLQARALTQSNLRRVQTGAVIDEIRILRAAAPAQASSAGQDATRADEEAQAAINAATAYADKTRNQATTAAAKIVQAATAYQEQVVHEANGEASRFDQVYAQYRKAPAVTRERLYLQTMEDVLGRANTVIVGARGTSPQIILSPQTLKSGQSNPPTSPATTSSSGGQP